MIETLADVPELFTLQDGIAVAFLLICIIGISWRVEHPAASHPSTHMLMRQHRRAWMRRMAERDVRIYDAQVLATLRQGASFFASAAMIALGGGAAVLGQADRVRDVASDLGAGGTAPVVVWEIKILLVLVLLAAAFLKFVWSIRLFGYCAVVMSSVPNDGSTDEARTLADTAAELNILADRSFTRGLRGVYFTIAGMAWFVGPLALGLATLFTLLVIYRREFRSRTRTLLLNCQNGTR